MGGFFSGPLVCCATNTFGSTDMRWTCVHGSRFAFVDRGDQFEVVESQISAKDTSGIASTWHASQFGRGSLKGLFVRHILSCCLLSGFFFFSPAHGLEPPSGRKASNSTDVGGL